MHGKVVKKWAECLVCACVRAFFAFLERLSIRYMQPLLSQHKYKCLEVCPCHVDRCGRNGCVCFACVLCVCVFLCLCVLRVEVRVTVRNWLPNPSKNEVKCHL